MSMAEQNLTLSSADDLNVEAEIEFFQSTSESLIQYAKNKGASEIEIGVSKDVGLSVSVRNAEIETLEYNRDNSFGITVYLGKQKGVATTSDLSQQSLHSAVDAALNIAKYTQADECAGLADASLMATQPVDLDLDHPMGVDAEYAKNVALECEKYGLQFSPQISNSEGATFNSHRNIRFYGNSHGFAAATPSSRHSLSCVLLAEDRLGKQRDHWYSIAREGGGLESAQSVGEMAAQRTIRRLGGRQLKTQKASVLFVPELARSLIGHLKSAITGANIYRKSSFLLDKVGESIFPNFVTMVEQPFIPRGLASAWHDGEGVATREQAIIDAGQLSTYLINSYSGRKLNLAPTGHAGGIHNLAVTTGSLGFEQLVKEMGTGLVVTEMMGHGINMITGDYSRGASGFWVENGEIQYFVQEITIAGNLNAMFANLRAIGNDIDHRSSIKTGSWLIDEMTIAGN